MVREADRDGVFGFNNIVERDLDANKWPVLPVSKIASMSLGGKGPSTW